MVCSFELLNVHLIVQVVFELKKIKLKCVECAPIRLFWEVWFTGLSDGLESELTNGRRGGLNYFTSLIMILFSPNILGFKYLVFVMAMSF